MLYLNSYASEPASETESVTESADFLYLTYDDSEPRRPEVRRVRFEGNDTFSSMVLRDLIATRAPGVLQRLQFWNRGSFEFSDQELRRDVVRIQRFYQRRGFHRVQITTDVETGNREYRRIVTFNVIEGEPTILEDLEIKIDAPDEVIEYIESQRDYQRALSRNPIATGRRYQSVLNPDVEADFNNALRNMGFAFSRTEVKAEVDPANGTATAQILMKPGPRGNFADITVSGEETVSKNLILRQSGLREGDQFSVRRMQEAQQLIFRHPLFRFVTVALPEQEEDENVDVRIRVREFPLRSIQVRGGFGTEELLRGQVTWTHRNPFGNGHRFTASTRASFIEQRASLEYFMPGIINPRSNISISPFAERINESNYLLLSGGINNAFIYNYSRDLVGNVSYEFTRNEEFERDSGQILRDMNNIYNISAIKVSAFYNRSTGERGVGWRVRPYAEFSGFLRTGTLVYQRFSVDVRRFIDISRTTQLAIRTDTGLLLTPDMGRKPSNIRFYSGGTNSVRGWSRNQLGPQRAVIDESTGEFREYLPLGGSAMFMFNTEIRQRVPFLLPGLEFAAFLDGGQVWEDYDDARSQDLQFGTGAGIRYMTPIGPIRLDFGYKLNPNDADLNRFNGTNHGGSNRWVIHFSIGQAF